MISDLDIWRGANLLIRQHGDGAKLAACQHADLMLERGDHDGQLVVGVDTAGDCSVAGAAGRAAELTAWSATSLLLR